MRVRINLCPACAKEIRGHRDRLIEAGMRKEDAERVACLKMAARDARDPCTTCRRIIDEAV